MFRTTFIAITGSVGKSTATAALGSILSSGFPTNWTPGGGNHRRVLTRTILRTRFRHRYTVIEVGTKAPGALHRAAWMIAPDVVIMLRVLNVHSNAFPSIEEMAAEKEELLKRLAPRGLALLNADDPHVMAMAARCHGTIRTFGRSPAAFVWASDVSSRWPGGLRFRVHSGEESSWVETQFIGEHFLNSALAAITAAVCRGVPLEKAAKVLETVKPVLGRMYPMILPNGVTVIRDEHNGTLPTIQAALDFLRDAQAKRRIVILGDALDTGMTEGQRHRLLGAQAAASADMGIFIGRTSKTSASAAVAAGMDRTNARPFKTLSEAAQFLKSELQPGDLVLLLGWSARHLERVILAQLGSISCWVEWCSYVTACDACPELKLVRLEVPEKSFEATRMQE